MLNHKFRRDIVSNHYKNNTGLFTDHFYFIYALNTLQDVTSKPTLDQKISDLESHVKALSKASEDKHTYKEDLALMALSLFTSPLAIVRAITYEMYMCISTPIEILIKFSNETLLLMLDEKLSATDKLALMAQLLFTTIIAFIIAPPALLLCFLGGLFKSLPVVPHLIEMSQKYFNGEYEEEGSNTTHSADYTSS